MSGMGERGKRDEDVRFRGVFDAAKKHVIHLFCVKQLN